MNAEDADTVLPLARVRRLMKEEPDIRAITKEASLLVTKAAELFLEALTAQALACKAGSENSSLTYADLAAAVSDAERLDFLRDVVPVKVPAKVVLEGRAGD